MEGAQQWLESVQSLQELLQARLSRLQDATAEKDVLQEELGRERQCKARIARQILELQVSIAQQRLKLQDKARAPPDPSEGCTPARRELLLEAIDEEERKMQAFQDTMHQQQDERVTSLAAQRQALERALDAQRAIESVVTANQRALQLAKQEAHDLQVQVGQLQEATAGMHKECADLQSKHALLRAALADAQEQRRQAAARALREDAAALERSTRRLEAARQRHATLCQETHRLTADIDAAKHEVAALAL